MIPDLVIEARETRPVVEALLELATNAEREAAADPDNRDLQDYAYAICRQYVCLRECNGIANLAKRTAELDDHLAERPIAEAKLAAGIEAAMAELRLLESYVKPGLSRVGRIRLKPPVDELLRGALGPKAVADLAERIQDIGATVFLDGVIATLREAPWAREGHFFHFAYFADPARRLEFLAACDGLIPKIQALRRQAVEVEGFPKAEVEAAKARKKVHEKWLKTRAGESFPPHIGSLVKEILDRQREDRS